MIQFSWLPQRVDAMKDERGHCFRYINTFGMAFGKMTRLTVYPTDEEE